MIQEIYPHRFNNQYIAGKQLEENDFILHYNGKSLLLKVCGDELKLPTKKDFLNGSGLTEATFLFTLDTVSCFLIWDEPAADPSRFIYKELSFFRTTNQKEIAWISLAGFHLKSWYTEHRFCGACGTKTHHKSDERAMICPDCGSVFYPKISPAIIVAIICNDKLLLANNTNFAQDWYSLIAGYVDIGETLEETVIREVKEEVGLDVKNIRYYKSQPWPLSGSEMVGFIAEADEHQPISIDNKEIAKAAWFSRENLPNHPTNVSIAGELIEKFEKGELR
ncbi:MAG: NAD(+) diphosphatase [Bacteroidota bacterium]|nr:NAD(+) diphosphatase [Bacteroidota bacterium]